MNFKKSILTALFIVIFIVAPANAELEIVLDSLSPQPVEPSQDFMLSITLANEFSEIENVKLTIVPDSPIILKNENDRNIYIGRIIKYGARAETYLLHIDPSATSGTYEIKFELRWLSDGQQRETSKTFNVMVQGAPHLVISNISINPELISPKDTFDITFSASNEGTGVARDVRITPATAGLPFVPVGADTKILKKLNPGESSLLKYTIQVKDSTDISSYSIPIKMDYKDENGKNISSQNLLGVKILGKAKLTIASIKIEPQNPEKGDFVTLTMRIENSGNGDAKSAKVSLDSPFKGTKTSFLGKIKPNDDAPAVFTFYATEDGDVSYSATMEFEDDIGIHSNKEALDLYIRNSNNNSATWLFIGAMLIIVACVFQLYRKNKIKL